jgi:hypothetical protein
MSGAQQRQGLNAGMLLDMSMSGVVDAATLAPYMQQLRTGSPSAQLGAGVQHLAHLEPQKAQQLMYAPVMQHQQSLTPQHQLQAAPVPTISSSRRMPSKHASMAQIAVARPPGQTPVRPAVPAHMMPYAEGGSSASTPRAAPVHPQVAALIGRDGVAGGGGTHSLDASPTHAAAAADSRRGKKSISRSISTYFKSLFNNKAGDMEDMDLDEADEDADTDEALSAQSRKAVASASSAMPRPAAQAHAVAPPPSSLRPPGTRPALAASVTFSAASPHIAASAGQAVGSSLLDGDDLVAAAGGGTEPQRSAKSSTALIQGEVAAAMRRAKSITGKQQVRTVGRCSIA